MNKITTFIAIAFCLNANAQIINTIAGTGIASYGGDFGLATSARISNPTSVVFDATGNVYIADYNNNRVRKIDALGVITTIAGTGLAGFSGDGGPATSAQLNLPAGLAINAAGNLYIADHANQRIRKINTSGIITTIAGMGMAGFSGDGGLAINAKINYPNGVAVDVSGNIYISDRNNNKVRIINSLGIISTFAGNGLGGFSGDGGAAISAQLSSPNNAVSFDAVGNVYIADLNNHRVRKVDTSGIISTFAGIGTSGFSGDGGAATSAELSSVFGVAIDAAGNLYIADFNNQRIRKVNTSGIISTYAGTGIAGFGGDGGLAINAKLSSPAGVSVDAAGNVYIPDAANQRVREISLSTGIEQISDKIKISIYPNPTSDKFTIATNSDEIQIIDLFDMNGRHVFSKSVFGELVIDMSTFDDGVYTLTVKTLDHVINKKIVLMR